MNMPNWKRSGRILPRHNWMPFARRPFLEVLTAIANETRRTINFINFSSANFLTSQGGK